MPELNLFMSSSLDKDTKDSSKLSEFTKRIFLEVALELKFPDSIILAVQMPILLETKKMVQEK